MNADMRAALPLEPPADFADPRLQPSFQPEHWPLCNNGPAPKPDTSDVHERRCLEFLAAFYRINLLNERLLSARKDTSPSAAAESVLAQIDAAMVALEKLEDRYAPIGFFGEPIMEGIRYRSIDFVRPELPRILSTASNSSHVAIPGLADIPPSELRGPAKITRWRHAKIDP